MAVTIANKFLMHCCQNGSVTEKSRFPPQEQIVPLDVSVDFEYRKSFRNANYLDTLRGKGEGLLGNTQFSIEKGFLLSLSLSTSLLSVAQ